MQAIAECWTNAVGEIVAAFQARGEALGELAVQWCMLETLTTLAEEAGSAVVSPARRQAVQQELLRDLSNVRELCC